MSDMFEFDNYQEYRALQARILELGVDYVVERSDNALEYVGCFYVDIELESEYNFIMRALERVR